MLSLRTKQAECLNDDAKNNVGIPKGLPGQLYDGNDQCVRMFGAGSRVCDIPDLKEVKSWLRNIGTFGYQYEYEN